MNTVMIIAGESSGELYGSLLARELKQRNPDIRIVGVGGQRMQEAGVEMLSTISDAFGLMEAVASLQKLKNTYKKVIAAMREQPPRVLVLIDYPDFNLKVAGKAKSLGIKILYYVSPQVWAWRKRRVKKIAGIVNSMAVILPFEEKLYKNAGLPCEFVGHPITEEIESVLKSIVIGQKALVKDDRVGNLPHPPLEKGGEGGFENLLKEDMKAALGLDPGKPLLSLLPGSRPHELQKLLPVMLDVVRKVRNEPDTPVFRGYQFCMPLAPNTDETLYSPLFRHLDREGVLVKKGESVRVLAASDLAVVASGTATLQTALLEVPMVVVYKLSPLTFQLGRRIVKVKHISLVNILSGRTVVRELLQEEANPEEIVKELEKILLDAGYREEMLSHYREVREQFQGKNASVRVAEIVTKMIGEE